VPELAVRGLKLEELRVPLLQRRQPVLEVRKLLFHPADLGESVENGREHASVPHGFDFLRQVSDPHGPAAVDLARVLRVVSREDPHQRRLPRPVRADEPPARLARDHPRQPVE
jgi:hypothetical protein